MCWNAALLTEQILPQNQEFVRPGFELGYKTEEGKYYLYNHLVFNILVTLTHGEYTAAREKYDSMGLESLENRHLIRRRLVASGDGRRSLTADSTASVAPASQATTPASSTPEGSAASGEAEAFYMVVGFEVSPCSIKREAGKAIEDIVEGAEIVYSYDVYWQDSNIKWASRWDAYLRMPGGKVGGGGLTRKQLTHFNSCRSAIFSATVWNPTWPTPPPAGII